MLPPELQFELRPRQARPWLRPIAVGVMLLVAAAWLSWLAPRQQRLHQMREELAQAQQQLEEAHRPPPPRGPVPAWQTNGEQDGRLFELQLEQRLLEVERCTGPQAIVFRLVHDCQSGDTNLQLTVTESAVLAELLTCLNSEPKPTRPWRVASVEAVSQPAPGGGQELRVALKR